MLADALDERVAIFHRHTEQVGDHQQRERTGKSLDELPVPRRQEVVEHLIGEHPHGVLVLFEALGGDQPHQQRAVIRVGRRVQRRQLVAERQLVTVLLDQLGDVGLTLQRHRKAGKRAGHRDARGERLRVVQHRAGLVPTGHHGDAVVWFAGYRTPLAQRLVVRVGILDKLPVTEEIKFGEVIHHVVLRFRSQLARICFSLTNITFPQRVPNRNARLRPASRRG